MSLEGESLGKSRLDLEANLDEFRRNMREGKTLSGGMNDSLKALAAVADIAEQALGDVKMSPFSASESSRIADRIERSVGGAGRAAMDASHHLEQVKLSAHQAAESDAAGDAIKENLEGINRKAKEAERALFRVKIAGGSIRPGYGVGPFGAGYGRLGVVGTLIGAGALTAPAAAPAAVGILAGIPTLAAGAAGALGTLILAFQGVGKAIGGDAKAYKELQPAQQQFVMTIRSMLPWVGRLKELAGANLFPGLNAGLHAALSPGTVNGISTALVGFAKAIGQAGAEWGRYFGSAKFQQIFGPLMAAGARNLAVLSRAALSLFDALGVLGRAAVPLVVWLADIAAKGAALADSWLRAQDASGALASAMSTAQSSLRLVGQLALSIVKAAIALGRALYPIALVIVPALTVAFNALAAWIDRNRGSISLFGVAITKDIIAVVRTAVTVVGKLGDVIEKRFGPTGVRVAIITTALAIGLLVNPWATVITAAILAAGEVIRHWDAVQTFFSNWRVFLIGLFHSAFDAIKGIVNLGVYSVLSSLEIMSRAAAKALGWIPGIGGHLKAALADIDGFIEGFRQRGIADLAQAGSDMGNAFGAAFTKNVYDALVTAQQEANAAFKKNKLGVGPGMSPPEQPLAAAVRAEKGPQEPAPGTHAWYMKYLGYDPTTVSAGSVFGKAPPFDKNVPKPKHPKKPKAPPLLPPIAAHALDLASANENKASNLGNVGAAAERYLGLEITDLETAAKVIRAKYGATVGKVHTQLFHALTGVMNKIRSARALLRSAIYQDRMASYQFALDMASLAMSRAKEGTAAYKKAEQQEIKLLRAEIAYLDKRVKNRKLSMALRQDALSAELSAQQQLNALLGQTATASTGNANMAQFLSSAQSIIHNYAPDFGSGFNEPVSTKQVETKGYETVHELRGINQKLQRILQRDDFPASGYATNSAEAVGV